MRKNVKECELLAVGYHSPQEVDIWIVKEFYHIIHVRRAADCNLITVARTECFGLKEPVFLIHGFNALSAIVDRGYKLIGFKTIVFVTPKRVGNYSDPAMLWLDYKPRVSVYWPPRPFDGQNFPRLLDRILPVNTLGQEILKKLRFPSKFEPDLEEWFEEQELVERFKCIGSNNDCDDELTEDLSEMDSDFSSSDTSWKRKDTGKSLTELLSPTRQKQIATLMHPQWRKPSLMKSFEISLWGTMEDVLVRMKEVFPKDTFEMLAPKFLETVFDYQLDWTTNRSYNKVTSKELAGDDENLKKKFVLMRKWMDSPPGIRLEGAYKDFVLNHRKRSWATVVCHHKVSPIDLHLLLSYQRPSDDVASAYPALDSTIDSYRVRLVDDETAPQAPYWPPASPMTDFFSSLNDG